jgi:hypothetical protein
MKDIRELNKAESRIRQVELSKLFGGTVAGFACP